MNLLQSQAYSQAQSQAYSQAYPPDNDEEISFFMNQYYFDESGIQQLPIFIENDFENKQKNHLTEYYMDDMNDSTKKYGKTECKNEEPNNGLYKTDKVWKYDVVNENHTSGTTTRSTTRSNSTEDFNSETPNGNYRRVSSSEKIEKLQSDIEMLQKKVISINDNKSQQKQEDNSKSNNVISIENIINYLHNNFKNAQISCHDKEKNIISFKRNHTKNIMLRIFEDKVPISNEMKDVFKNYLTETNSNGIIVYSCDEFESKPVCFMENNYGNILIYIKIQITIEKLKMAISSNDMIMSFISQNEKSEQKCNIEKSVLYEIYREYTQFQAEKEHLIETLKEEHRKTIHLLQHNFKCNFMEEMLSKNLMKLPKNELFKCNICNVYNAHNLKALSAHKRGCCKKHGKTISPTYELEDYKN